VNGVRNDFRLGEVGIGKSFLTPFGRFRADGRKKRRCNHARSCRETSVDIHALSSKDLTLD
jgi:hypothetical protein